MSEEDENATIPSRIAHLTEHQDADYPHVVHGVAHGENEYTNGLNGLKFWPSEEVEKAAASLEGQAVYAAHDDGDRREVGTVLRAAYEQDVGVVYEAGLTDAEIAEELSLGQREVSIEASADRADRDEETGAAILRDYSYTALTTPESGASEGNYTAPGPAEGNPALAALSAGAIESALSDDAVSPESGQAEGMGGEETTESDTTMTENEDENPDVTALLERVDERDNKIEELESKLAEKEERIGELEDYGEEIGDVKESYASALAEGVDVVDEDDLVDKFTVGELREKFEAREDAQLAETEPDVQSGDGTTEEPEEEAELEADPETLEARIAALKGAGMTEKATELKAELED